MVVRLWILSDKTVVGSQYIKEAAGNVLLIFFKSCDR